MSITAAMVKDLREKTAAGMMDCKKALTECDGDMEKAVDWLRQKGLSKAAKKAGRATSEGLVGFELAADGKSGVAVEVKCETDFVARGDKFQGFVKDMVAQVAKGEYADSEALLAAPFVADASVTVKEALDGVIATTGENMGLGKFAKMELAAGKSGLIGGYLHSNGKLAVLVEMQTRQRRRRGFRSLPRSGEERGHADRRRFPARRVRRGPEPRSGRTRTRSLSPEGP